MSNDFISRSNLIEWLLGEKYLNVNENNTDMTEEFEKEHSWELSRNSFIEKAVKYIRNQPPVTQDVEAIKELLSGEWVDSDRVQRALGMNFTECYKLFDFSRTSEWWSIVGKTEKERARNGQKITTRFRIKTDGK